MMTPTEKRMLTLLLESYEDSAIGNANKYPKGNWQRSEWQGKADAARKIIDDLK